MTDAVELKVDGTLSFDGGSIPMESGNLADDADRLVNEVGEEGSVDAGCGFHDGGCGRVEMEERRLLALVNERSR